MGVLVALAEQATEVVTRDELLARVWPGLVVTDDSISRTVYRLRQQLARAGGDERYRSLLETLPKRGYRLTARVEPISEPPAAPARAADGTSSVAAPAALAPPVLWSLGAALAAVALAVAFHARDGHDAPTERRITAPATILVLPFANLSAQGDHDYFGAGLAEEVRTLLARSPEIRVIGRTSSEAVGTRPDDVRSFARRLGVTHALEASVRHDSGRVRVVARLLDDTGIPVWGDSFDRDLRGVLELQSEIASSVARAVSAHVVPPNPADRMPAFEAYDAYLAGRDLLYRRDYRGARHMFERATRFDPDFAAAHAELAISFAIGWPAAENLARADRAIARALEIEPELVRAQAGPGGRRAVAA